MASAGPNGQPVPASRRASSYGVVIHGLYLTPDDSKDYTGLIDQFADNLRQSPFVASVKVPIRTTSDQSSWDYDYEFEVELKQGIAAQ
jgi:hypothetical protein